jgi:hypothetical protein
MVKRRSLQEIIEQTDALGDAFEQYEPSGGNLVHDVLADEQEGWVGQGT